MTITKNQNGDSLTVALEGRLDTTTAPELDKVLRDSLAGVTDLKAISKRGRMKVCNVGEIVREVFEVTGFVDILEIA